MVDSKHMLWGTSFGQHGHIVRPQQTQHIPTWIIQRSWNTMQQQHLLLYVSIKASL